MRNNNGWREVSSESAEEKAFPFTLSEKIQQEHERQVAMSSRVICNCATDLEKQPSQQLSNYNNFCKLFQSHCSTETAHSETRNHILSNLGTNNFQAFNNSTITCNTAINNEPATTIAANSLETNQRAISTNRRNLGANSFDYVTEHQMRISN